ncbi:class II aldolase/adducin family protein, partial [Nonomuraea rubra]|uniref:class II aldolase/adducin family protein n=1 Tax=Nonomuraea rubra TaxID=46180 RepID=UPI0031E9A242
MFDDAVLVRDRARGRALAEHLADAPALVMRGNGAVTVGASVGEAVALMWVLEASARMNATAAASGTPTPHHARRAAGLAGRAYRTDRPHLVPSPGDFMIELTDIAYVRSGAADLDNAVRFAVDIVGMELTA